MLRFHNRVVDDNPKIDLPSLQKIVRWHYQWGKSSMTSSPESSPNL
jgi:hypothetical protein